MLTQGLWMGRLKMMTDDGRPCHDNTFGVQQIKAELKYQKGKKIKKEQNIAYAQNKSRSRKFMRQRILKRNIRVPHPMAKKISGMQ